MEEKKFDLNSIIGFVLIFGILVYMMYANQPTPEELAQEEQAKQEQVEAAKKVEKQNEAIVTSSEDYSAVNIQDSTQLVALQNKLGAFAYSASLPSAKSNETEVNTDVLDLKFSNKGGYLSEVKLKKFVDFDSIPIYLIKDGNTNFNINFGTSDSRILNTKDLYFEPTVTKNGENTVVSMKLKVSANQFLEYRYEMQPNNYMVDFTIRSQGLSNVINSSQPIDLDWKLTTYRHDKSISYENRYTRLTYQYEGEKIDKLSPTGEDEETEADVNWLSYRQHFFSSILTSKTPLKSVRLNSTDLVENEEIDTVFTKTFQSKFTLEANAGELNQELGFYFGPTDNKVLQTYDIGLEDSIPFGWGIFGWINRYVFVPLFAFLAGFLPYGIAIIVMTVLIKMLLSFVQYKQFLSQAKLKVLKPELDAIREKHKDNKMKAQQETMALQNKAGASLLCFIPIFSISFRFKAEKFPLGRRFIIL